MTLVDVFNWTRLTSAGCSTFSIFEKNKNKACVRCSMKKQINCTVTTLLARLRLRVSHTHGEYDSFEKTQCWISRSLLQDCNRCTRKRARNPALVFFAMNHIHCEYNSFFWVVLSLARNGIWCMAFCSNRAFSTLKVNRFYQYIQSIHFFHKRENTRKKSKLHHN